jgi:hypothetical protein
LIEEKYHRNVKFKLRELRGFKIRNAAPGMRRGSSFEAMPLLSLQKAVAKRSPKQPGPMKQKTSLKNFKVFFASWGGAQKII